MSAVPVDPPRRLFDLEVDGATVRVPEGATILDACRAEGVDTPTLCYAENLTPVNACRVCVVEVEGSRTLVPACCRDGRARHEGHDRHRARAALAQARDGVPGVVGRDGPRERRRPPLDGRVRGRTPTGSAPRWSRSRRGSATRGSRATTTRPTTRRGRERVPTGEDRQRAVRARLLALHPLLQVRRGLRRRRPEHVRDRGGGPRVRRADLHRVRRAARRVGLRLLRQLHRRVSHGRADVHERARDARGGHLGRGATRPSPARSARTAAWAASSISTCRTTRS